MAEIVINEISQNYAYNIGNSSYATVAMPITASWGPGYEDSVIKLKADTGISTASVTTEVTNPDPKDALENVQWTKFPASQKGLEAFISTYRGPEACFRLASDFSYQMAMTLLVAGYDVLVCRIVDGSKAYAEFGVASTYEIDENGDMQAPTDGYDAKFENPEEIENGLKISAKYFGSFGNKLKVCVLPNVYKDRPYFNVITYIREGGTSTAVENISFRLFDDESGDYDTIPYIDEVESAFLSISIIGDVEDAYQIGAFTPSSSIDAAVSLLNGSDYTSATNDDTKSALLTKAFELAGLRYSAQSVEGQSIDYVALMQQLPTNPNVSLSKASVIAHNEAIYTGAYTVYDLLTDKLNYNPNRVIASGWDDQNFDAIYFPSNPNIKKPVWTFVVSPLHAKLMDVSYAGRCATAYLDVPKCLPRGNVSIPDNSKSGGYAQMLSNYKNADPLYPSHSELTAPWGQFQYSGTSKMYEASPAFLHLMIDRAMILNQSIRYEWALPTNRKTNLNFGKLAYNVPKHVLDVWQSGEGVGVNVITNIPDIGLSLWGNSTLFNLPVATYQALANLSTRKLVNAVEDLAYRCGISITFQYNNEQAYNAFYAGMTPLLDTMKNVGAIEDYRVQMAADINGLDRVNANTVIGKIILVVNGVVNDIKIDLIALPPQADITQYTM